MFAEILHELAEEIKEKEAEWTDLLKREFSYQEIEQEILDVVNDLFARLVGSLLAEALGDREVQRQVRRFGGKLAYRFVGYQEVTIRLARGLVPQSRASISGSGLLPRCIASVVASGIARRPDSQETGTCLQAVEKPSVERRYCRFAVSDYADGRGEIQEENAEGHGIL